MKNLFKSYTYAWKEIGVFKLALLSIGVIIGTIWAPFFSAHMTTLMIIAGITTLYTMYISLNQ